MVKQMQIEEEAAAPFLMNEYAFKTDQLARDYKRQYFFNYQLNSPLKNHALDKSRDFKLNQFEEKGYKAKGIFRDESQSLEQKQKIAQNTF